MTAENKNFKELLEFIDERMKKNHKPNPELVKKHNANPLNKKWQISESAEWEQSDVIHDILAHLSKQMTEMSTQKQKEIKGFLEWMEREIGVKVDDLKNKKKIKDYHKYKFEEIVNILKENKKKITKVDLHSRSFQEDFKKEFEKSIGILSPLKIRIQATDELIDQIVYKLYGLTPNEMKIVDESVQGKGTPTSEGDESEDADSTDAGV